ncbi:hypothetical protein [Marinoscillum sp.]|uniref:hypothetical protein n=1 Tax=Marinoscillum sp. TaxID=2024838 RepID=UPI003BAA2CA7
MTEDSRFTYNYRFRIGQLVNFLIGAGFLGVVIFLLQLPFELDKLMWVLIPVLAIMGLIPFGLTLHYWFRSFGLRITIDAASELIEVMHRGRFNTFKFNELTSIEICEHEDVGRYGFDFSFAKYSFSNGKHCIATAFMTNQYFVPDGIEPRIYKEIIPVIWKRTNV